MFHFNTPWTCQKTQGFLTFSGGIEMENWLANESSYLADAGKLQQWHDTASIILSRQLHTQNVTIETPEKDVKYVQS